jgi:predicted MFS family arabinose efflux permease
VLFRSIGLASTPQTRSQAFGVMAIAFSISGLLGPMFAGFAIDFATYAVAFAILGLLPLASAALVFLPRRLAIGRAGARTTAQPVNTMDLLRHAPLRAVFFVSGLISMGWDLFTFMVPLLGVRIGLSASAIGLVVGAFGAGSFAVRLAIPALMRTFDEWAVLRATLGLTALCYLAFPFCGGMATLLPLSFLTGMVLGCGQPLGMSLVHTVAPPERSGEVVGVRSTITSISQTVLPLLFGALGTAVGMVPVFWTAATVLASGSAYAGRRRPY